MIYFFNSHIYFTLKVYLSRRDGDLSLPDDSQAVFDDLMENTTPETLAAAMANDDIRALIQGYSAFRYVPCYLKQSILVKYENVVFLLNFC